MKLYGLIGFPLTHSFSQKYFSEKFSELNLKDHQYRNFPLTDISELNDLIINQKELSGLNVTIPYKEQALPLMNELSEEAGAIGAVNTIVISRNKDKVSLKGHNTDYYGFMQSIKPYLENIHHRALILGTGGASKAVEYFFKNTGIDYLKVSRDREKGDITYNELNEALIKSHLLIVNTTPLGMSPSTEEFPPIPYEFLGNQHLVYDLIYNPAETLFLKKAKEKGAVTINGTSMLKLQAERSWKIWNNENNH